MIVAAGNALFSLAGATGKEEWRYNAGVGIVSSPAIGDVNGDGAPEVVFGAGQSVVCVNAFSGHEEWKHATGGYVYSSPALGSRGRSEPYRTDWPMYRHDPQRTGFFGYQPGPLGVYIGSDDGFLYLIDGVNGRRIDRFAIQFPELVITSHNYGPLKFLSSPSLADIDGTGTLKAIFTLVDRVWAIEDTGSTSGPKPATPPANAQVETARKRTAPTRNSFVLAQLVHAGGWNPSIPVPATMLEELTKRAKLDVAPEIQPVSLRDDEITSLPFLYITGHEAVKFTDAELQKLKGHLDRGGFLFAEACCNSQPFDRSIRDLCGKLFNDNKLIKLPKDHPIYSKVYPIKTVRVKNVAVEPDFEGIEVKGRLVFLVTRHDYACSWGNPCCTSGCIGVATEDSYRMFTNIVVYALTE